MSRRTYVRECTRPKYPGGNKTTCGKLAVCFTKADLSENMPEDRHFWCRDHVIEEVRQHRMKREDFSIMQGHTFPDFNMPGEFDHEWYQPTLLPAFDDGGSYQLYRCLKCGKEVRRRVALPPRRSGCPLPSKVQKDMAFPLNDKPEGTGPDIPMLVCMDVEARAVWGEKKYGERLKGFNGRNALIDAYQEVLDLAVYIRQLLAEQGLQDPAEPRGDKI